LGDLIAYQHGVRGIVKLTLVIDCLLHVVLLLKGLASTITTSSVEENEASTASQNSSSLPIYSKVSNALGIQWKASDLLSNLHKKGLRSLE